MKIKSIQVDDLEHIWINGYLYDIVSIKWDIKELSTGANIHKLMGSAYTLQTNIELIEQADSWEEQVIYAKLLVAAYNELREEVYG